MADLTSSDGAAPISAEVVNEGPATVVRLVGELDISSVESVRPVVDSAVAGSPEHLIFDLTRLKFMDSTGIALMLFAASAVKKVEVRNPTPIIRQVIERTGLAETLRIS